MSKEYWKFENEKGDIAFLAGVVDVISDRLSLLCDYAYALDADIFPLESNNVESLNYLVKKRLHNYKEQIGGFSASDEEIDSLDFQLKKIEVNNVSSYLSEIIKSYSSRNNILEEVDEFLNTLCWQLHKPMGIYVPIKSSDKNIDVLGKIYLYLAWDYIFIHYNKYMVLLIWGTVE